MGSKLSVLTLQETFLVLVFKAGTNSVSKYVTVRSLTGRKKPTAEEAGRLSILGWGAESIGDLVPGDLMYLIPLFVLKIPTLSFKCGPVFWVCATYQSQISQRSFQHKKTVG